MWDVGDDDEVHSLVVLRIFVLDCEVALPQREMGGWEVDVDVLFQRVGEVLVTGDWSYENCAEGGGV